MKVTKAKINKCFKPLSRALINEGKKRAIRGIERFRVVATRGYNRPGSLTSWSPYYVIMEGDSMVHYGSRDECVEWLYQSLNSGGKTQ